MTSSRGKNATGFRRENKTLGWYMNIDDNQRENAYSPALNKRKNSFDSESSGGRQSSNENKKRSNKARGNHHRSENSQNNDQVLQNVDNTHSDPINITNTSANDGSLVGSDQPAAVLQQHLLAMSVQPTIQKENYSYYDPNTDGYFYELSNPSKNFSHPTWRRGWRRRNPALHGNPPMNMTNKMADEQSNNMSSVPHTIEKKVYVPIPVPVFPNSKFFPQAGTSPNIKYFDSNGFYFETPHADIWKKRATNPATMHGMDLANQRPKVEPSSLTSFPPLGRDLTSHELEELILSKVKTNTMDKSLPFASVVARNLKNSGIQQQRQPEEYPRSSSSTVSSSVSDDTTPPPVAIGKENQCQQLFAQTKEPNVGSFEEPYEFYWSDNEKAENTQQEASSVSSMDDYNPLSAYFNEMNVNNGVDKQNVRVQRPSSLKIMNPNSAANDKRLPRFNVDKFIADLPGNDNFINGMSTIYAPFGMDSPRTPFNGNQYMFNKESPMFTPLVKERPWRQFPNLPVEDLNKDKASADIERGLRDIEKIWQFS